MSISSSRKLHTYQQMLHTAMVAIPLFYSDKPTNILVLQNVPIAFLSTLQTQVHQKLYYKSNKPKLISILSYEFSQKAIQIKEKIQKEMQSKSIKYECEFCKQISGYNGILFQGGKNFAVYPETKQMKEIIDTIAQSVVMNGADLEQKLKTTQQPMLAFLNERTLSLQHMYYRWRVYSYLQGDGDKKYRVEPFQIISNGFTWYPPLSTSQYPTVMNIKQIKYFTDCLNKMERKKFAIEEAMIFAIYNINYAVHISLIIMINLFESLRSDFMGTMYLISDILLNSQNHIYRNIFQSKLPCIIDSYVLMKQSDHSKSMNDKYLNQLKKLFSMWGKRYIFDENFMRGILFILELIKVEKMQQVCDMPEHSKIRQIFGGDQYLYELQKNCIENGIPFFQQKEVETRVFLNALFWENDTQADVQPDFGKYDGQAITQKQLVKIQSKGLKVISCQSLPVSILFDKNWKSLKSSGMSQDGA